MPLPFSAGAGAGLADDDDAPPAPLAPFLLPGHLEPTGYFTPKYDGTLECVLTLCSAKQQQLQFIVLHYTPTFTT